MLCGFGRCRRGALPLGAGFLSAQNAGIFKSAKGLLLGDLDLPLLQSERITDGFAHDSELPVISQTRRSSWAQRLLAHWRTPVC